jgi:Beta-galactosidase trimerisation domain
MRRIFTYIIVIAALNVNLYGASTGDKGNVLFKYKSSVLLKPAKEKIEIFKIAFPNFKQQADKTLCLRFKAYLKYPGNGGWGPYLGLKVNGNQLGEKTSNGKQRLLNRGDALIAIYNKKPHSSQWWRLRADIPCLYMFFTDGNVKYLMSSIIAPKEAGLEYLLDISDFASQIISTKVNSIEFINTFTKAQNKAGKVKGMLVSDVAIVYLSKSEMLKYRKPFIKVTPAIKTFTINNAKNLNVSYRGKTLIEKDELVGLANIDVAKLTGPEKVGNASVVNIIQENTPVVNFRKEVVQHDNGILELTIKAKYESYTDAKRGYSFYVPIATLEGASYKALMAKGGPNFANGIISKNMKEGPFTKYHPIRYISFKKKDMQLVFDLNPRGSLCYPSTHWYGELTPNGKVEKRGKYLKFSFFHYPAMSYGTLNAAKVLIYEGSFDYETKHPFYSWSYGTGIYPTQLFTFGTKVTPEGIDPFPPSKIQSCDLIKGDTNPYNKTSKFGWLGRSDKLVSVEHNKTDIFKNCVAVKGTVSKTFQTDIQPGLYITTVHAGNPERDSGPFSIAINGEVKEENISIPAGESRQFMLDKYLETNTTLEVTFSGKDWAVNSIAIQPIIYSCEDFNIKRKLWVKQGLYEPDTFVVPYKSSVKPTKLSNAWKQDMKCVSWTRANNNTGFEFNTPELVEKRVLELKAKGYDTIMEGVFFWHNTRLHRWDEGIRMVRMITDSAHKHDMRVVHHIDTTILTNFGSGLDYMLNNLSELQQHVQYRFSLLTGICVNNPDFQRKFLDRFKDFAEKTNCDGYMFDERMFLKKACGCEHCRKLFSKAYPGMKLPESSASKTFYNFDSPIWRAWTMRRQQSQGDFGVKIREMLDSVDSNIVFMSYSVDVAFTGNACWGARGNVPVSLAVSMFEDARGVDYLGLENLVYNDIVNYRISYALRKATTAVRDHYNPTSCMYAFEAHGFKSYFAYFTWAIDQMTKIAVRTQPLPGVDTERYLKWPYRMNWPKTKTVADVGIMFSHTSRDVGKKYKDVFESTSISDALGTAECLSDAHIQYDFLIEPAVTLKKLKQYKVVILPSVACMNSEQVKAVREYVKQGGTLVVSGNTSIQDRTGSILPDFALSDVMGVSYDPNDPVIAPPDTIKILKSNKTINFTENSLKVKLNKGTTAKVIAQLGGTSSPAIVENKFGMGKSIYLASRLGMAVCQRIPPHDHSFKNQRRWEYVPNYAIANLLIKIVKQAIGDNKLTVRAVQVPEAVIVELFEQSDDGKKSYLLNLLNATGGPALNLKKGDCIPGWSTLMKHPFPALKKDIIIDLKEPVNSAYVVSPDYKGKRPVKLEKQANGYTRITLNKNDLQVYSIIYLTNKEK